MYFSNKTIYDKKRLIRFNDFCMLRKGILWGFIIFVAICVLLQYLSSALLSPNGVGDPRLAILYLIFLVLVVFVYFVFPRLGRKKSPAFNAETSFEFGEDGFKVCANTSNLKETADLKYSSLVKVMEGKQDIYLFISKRQSYIIDKSGFTAGNPEDLIIFLQSKNIPFKR